MPEIEKGIPIAPIKRPGATRKAGNKYPFDQMDVGDSFAESVVDKSELKNRRNAVFAAFRRWQRAQARDSFILVSRVINDREVRFWRFA